MLGKIALGFLATTVALTGYIVQDGFVHVSVDQARKNGTHLHLVVPAELATIAAHFAPPRQFQGHQRELRALLPALKLSAAELAKLPDSILVEVRDGQQHVVISKSGDGLSVEEDSPKERVKVWVPLHAIYDTAGVLESRANSEAGSS
jgi:hypothetical protein